MASLETTCERLFTQEGAWRRTLFGGLLCLSIVGIPFAAGYLFLYAIRAQGQSCPPLPEWKDYGKLLQPGLHFLAIFGMWYVMPVLLAWAAGSLVEIATLGLLWWGGYVLAGLGMALSASLFMAALYHYQQEQSWSALWDYTAILRLLKANAALLVIPTLAWAGLLGVFLPLLPFAFFLGFIVLVAYYMPHFSE